jgi:hypothetical protein
MSYFKLNERLEVTEISPKYPDNAGNITDWYSKSDGSRGAGWACRQDFDSFMLAQQVADSASKLTGKLYVATDAGNGVYPRYDVIETPAVGDDVSYSFNGDSYPCGKIVSVSKTLKKITTSEGKVFYRRKSSGCWLMNGTWALVGGHRYEKNPHF